MRDDTTEKNVIRRLHNDNDNITKLKQAKTSAQVGSQVWLRQECMLMLMHMKINCLVLRDTGTATHVNHGSDKSRDKVEDDGIYCPRARV